MSALTTPRGGIPPLAAGATNIAEAANRLAAGTGPIAIDTERASSFRYDDRAFVIQAKRAGAGIVLFDVESQPAAVSKHLAPVVNNQHWIVHAAPTDLPCLADLGLFPGSLFDTELAGRLLGFSKVNLSAMTEEFLGFSLKKEHSAKNWSTRPLPDSWLNYAALDVELLLELADAMTNQLTHDNKLTWLEQDCKQLVRLHRQPQQMTKTWLDLKGLSRLKSRKQLAVARKLWTTRQEIGAATDTACSLLLPDKALMAIAMALPHTKKQLFDLRLSSRMLPKYAAEWVSVVRATVASPPSTWPSQSQVRKYQQRHEQHYRTQLHHYPEVRAVLDSAREVINSISKAHNVQADSLMQPLALRKIIWEVVHTETIRNPDQLYSRLEALDVRTWQLQLAFEPLAVLLFDTN